MNESMTLNARRQKERLQLILEWRQSLPSDDRRMFDAMLANARMVKGLDYAGGAELVAMMLLKVKDDPRK